MPVLRRGYPGKPVAGLHLPGMLVGDYFTADEDEPSDQNHGLSLAEARLNFRVFGICDPWLRRKEEE